MTTNKYDSIIERCSITYVLDIALIKALIQVESSFREKAYRYEPNFYSRYIKNNPNYINHKYYGLPRIISASFSLTQIMYTTAEELGMKDIEPDLLYDPEVNIGLGCKLLRKKINKYGPELGILAYNSGSPRMFIPEMENNYIYLQKIAKYYKKFGGTNEDIIRHKL